MTTRRTCSSRLETLRLGGESRARADSAEVLRGGSAARRREPLAALGCMLGRVNVEVTTDRVMMRSREAALQEGRRVAAREEAGLERRRAEAP